MSKETIYIAMELSDKFNAAFPDEFIPEGIIDKTKCRVGITYTAFHEKRHTITVVPSQAIIDDAVENYPNLNLFPVMQGVTVEQIANYLKSGVKHLKIVSTPDSFGKIIKAALSIGKLHWVFKKIFLYLDEYHCYATEAYRENILTPFDDDNVWKFENKAFGSATPFPISDPRFALLQRYKLTYREKFGTVTIINTPYPNAVLQNMLTHPDDFFPGKGFIFYNSVTASGEAIVNAKLTNEDAAVFCREDERNLWNLGEASACFHHQPKDGEYKKFNIFSRRYDEGWALRDTSDSTLILMTDVKRPHTIVGIPFQGFQAIGRLEQPPKHIYHITNNYGKDNMRTFETIAKNWFYNSGKHIAYYNEHRLACLADGIEQDEGIKTLIKSFARINANEEAELYNPKLDQVICAEWIKEHYANVNTIRQAWEDLNYNTEIQRFYLPPVVKQNTSKQTVNEQLIEQWEHFKNNPESYSYNIGRSAIAKDKMEFALLAEAYHVLGKSEIERLNYNDQAMKEALIETSNKNSEAKLRLILIEEYKLDSRHTKNSMKVRLQELYDQFGIKKPDGNRKIATALQFEELGLFRLKECKIKDEHGISKSGFEIISVMYTVKSAA